MKSLSKHEEGKNLPATLPEMEKILSSLANEDALKIFHAAKDDITSSTKTIKELELTQKRYYTRLNQLMEAGLIERDGNVYQQTMLGKLCYKLGEAFENILNQRDRLDLAHRLQKSPSITLEETEKIMQAILKQANIGLGERMEDFLAPVRIADSWEKVVHDIVEYIEKAEECIYFVTKYFDIRVVEAVLRAIQRGVELRAIGDESQKSFSWLLGQVQMVRAMLSQPKMIKFFLKFISSSKFQVRFIALPYTFIVVDRKYAMVEVTKPFTDTFSIAFFFHNGKLCGRLIENFEVLWKRASPMKKPISIFK